MSFQQPDLKARGELSQRQLNEAIFHDHWAEQIEVDDINLHAAFFAPTAAENQFILGRFGDLKGKRILDLGCGMGDASIFFALQGATVSAIDISSGMVEVTKNLAEKHNVSNHVFARQMPAETLDFEDDTFDLVYGNGVLHHVDILRSISEVYRVTKQGGQIAFIEPLSYNPLIWIYRFMAHDVRSKDEHPLSINDIKSIINGNGNHKQETNFFRWQEGGHSEFHMFTLLIMVWFLIGEGIHPSAERYWKLFVERGERYRVAYTRLRSLDVFFQRILPVTKWLSWNTVVFLKK